MADEASVASGNLPETMDKQTVLAVLQFLKKNNLTVRN